MSKGPKLTNYVSELDKFLQEFAKTHPNLNKSQQKEVKKHQRVFRFRDTTHVVPEEKKFWDKF